MKRLFLSILCLAAVSAIFGADGSRSVACGSWLEISATPYEDYHFVRWSDGNTDSVRQIQVNEDASYIAFFAANCEEYANWPVVALYDWLLMLNVRKINQLGYYFAEDAVTWYRAVGEIDDLRDPDAVRDDAVMGTGYYLTIEQNLRGTGDYYAIVDVSANPQGLLCADYMRSEIVHYSAEGSAHNVALMPNITYVGGTMKLVGLDPRETTTISVYSATGRLVEQLTSEGEDTFFLRAAGITGCYTVLVSSPSMSTTLRYVVHNR